MDNQRNMTYHSTPTNFLQPLILQSHVIADHNHVRDQNHEDEEEEKGSRTRFTNMFDDTNIVRYYKSQNPRKKRSKLLRINDDDNSLSITTTNSETITKPKCTKKPPDPNAPKITKPCTECGKKFWSWKALFGHMRCHPEREWRGINPPPNLKRQSHELSHVIMTNEDQEIAESLLLLSNGPPRTNNCSSHDQLLDDKGVYASSRDISNFCKYECSSCKKVFGSHQALGGHRATHKNVKGCFANTSNCYGECSQLEDGNMGIMCPIEKGRRSDDSEDIIINESKKLMVLGGHKCGICLTVFSSGQALGGHMRRHWEKIGDEIITTAAAESDLTLAVIVDDNQKVRGNIGNLDLNFPPVTISGGDDQDDSSASYSSISGLELNLRLGL